MEGVDQSGQEASFAFPCDTKTALTAPHPRVEQVPHRVAEHVGGVDDNRQAKSWPERQPWRHLHVATPFTAEHGTPVRNLGWQTESQEAQSSRGDNYPPDVDAEDDDDGRYNIGQHMS